VKRHILLAALASLTISCSQAPAPNRPAASGYFDNAGRDDVLSGGVKMISISTPKGEFHVWTKRVGNNPTIKVLLLHGGPGFTHEYLEAFDSYFPGAGIEYYHYDQLGSTYSDQPDEPDLWDTARFVDEVEQVRNALHLDGRNLYLFGHSWGGILAIEYALQHPETLNGLIISNMMSSIPAYNEYAEKVLMPEMDQKALAEIKALEAAGKNDDPRYMELLMPNHYEKHILRMPGDRWPDPVMRSMRHLNPKVYVPMQGPSELGAGGRLARWDRTADLGRITLPALVIGARYDTMDAKFMEMMSKTLKKGRYLYCPNGSHLAIYDDQRTYMDGIIGFLKDVDAGKP